MKTWIEQQEKKMLKRTRNENEKMFSMTHEIIMRRLCNHQYRKTEPSLLNAEGVLLWRCVFCNKTAAST